MENKIKIFMTSMCCLIISLSCSELRNNPYGKTCNLECHYINLGQYLPDSGRHSNHIDLLVCENCHYDYYRNILHKNGVEDCDNNNTIVYFCELNPDSSWDNERNKCYNIACHSKGHHNW